MPLPHAKKNAFVEFSCRFSGTKISYCPRHLSVAKQVIFRTFELNSRLRIIAILDVKLKFPTLRSLLAAFDICSCHIDKLHFITGKLFSNALILASTNPQYDKRFIQ